MNIALESNSRVGSTLVCPAAVGPAKVTRNAPAYPEPVRTPLPDTSSDPLIRTAHACAAAGEYVLANRYLISWLMEAGR